MREGWKLSKSRRSPYML
uniref:Uncharacterized protein n=1 Tax=Rhizophora mucronata TaxID=61149 RepID=A0A2P2PHJ2_RHIMU